MDMEMADYVNEQPRLEPKHSGDSKQTERRLCQVLLLSFGLLCITQAALNVSLRLTVFSSKNSTHSDCSATQLSDKSQMKEVEVDCERKRPSHCNRLQERFNAVVGEKNLLENENNKLTNELKAVEKERDDLRLQLQKQKGCVSVQRCPAGWRQINSRCYFLSTESKTWQESKADCRSKGADLVVISSEQEQRDLYRLDRDTDLLFWIGLYNIAGTFKWVDGSALTISYWQRGQPDRGGPNNVEDCVEMYHFNPVLANWNDAPCGSFRRWLCEKALPTINLVP